MSRPGSLSSRHLLSSPKPVRMRLGVHQPYLFPYLPYYQLLFAVDRFVAHDDATWIKGGWINRNRALSAGRPSYFTIPVHRVHSTTPIDAVEIAPGAWRETMMRRLEQSYRTAPFRDVVLTMFDRAVTSSSLVADVAISSLEAVRDYLGYSVPIVRARGRYPQQELRGQSRVIAICRAEGATEYLNAAGGSALYDRHAFREAGVTLRFLRPLLPPYDHGSMDFVPGLSIIDVLMYNSVDQARRMMDAFEVD
jgi:WbqC-like protein